MLTAKIVFVVMLLCKPFQEGLH